MGRYFDPEPRQIVNPWEGHAAVVNERGSFVLLDRRKLTAEEDKTATRLLRSALPIKNYPWALINYKTNELWLKKTRKSGRLCMGLNADGSNPYAKGAWC